MDVVYPLGRGSNWDNLELAYSIASVRKNLYDAQNIYVIGEHPGFELDFIHVPYSDFCDKDTNICNKVLQACKIDELSRHFVFMNDDVYINRPTSVFHIKDTYIGELYKRSGMMQDKDYGNLLNETHYVLNKKGLPTLDFDAHMPVVFNKDYFPRAIKLYDWTKPNGYAVKSIYFNTMQSPGVWSDDMKISKPVKDLQAYIGNRWCFSVGDNGLTQDMKLFLANKFS